MTNRYIMQPFAALAGATLLLAACGGESAGNDTNGSAEADVGASAVKAVIGGVTGVGVSVSDLPDFAEVPSGSNAIHNMAVNQDGKLGARSHSRPPSHPLI